MLLFFLGLFLGFSIATIGFVVLLRMTREKRVRRRPRPPVSAHVYDGEAVIVRTT